MIADDVKLATPLPSTPTDADANTRTRLHKGIQLLHNIRITPVQYQTLNNKQRLERNDIKTTKQPQPAHYT